MGQDHYYNAFADDDNVVTVPGFENDINGLAQTIDPHLYSKLIFGMLSLVSLYLVLVHVLFQIELGKKITETAANMPDDMTLTEEIPASQKSGTVAVLVNASVVQMPEYPSDSGPKDIQSEKPPKASAIQSLEQCKMAELMLIAAALVLMIFLLLVFLPSGNILLSVIGLTCVTGAFFKDQIKSEWRKERYDRMITVITIMLFIASSLSLATYASMGIAEGPIYKGAARIVNYDESEYANRADEMITRIDLEVSWGGSWGCPLMDKTCYAEVQGALCEQKDRRDLRRLNQSSDKIVTKSINNENISRREEVVEDEVYYTESGDKEEIITSTYDDDFESMEEETEVITNANGTVIEEVESYDIKEIDGTEEETEEVIYFEDGTEVESYDVYEKNEDEEITEELYYFKDESEDELYIEENIENADGTSEDIVYDSEYEIIDGEEEEVYAEDYYKKADGSAEEEVDIYSYDSNDGAAELVGEELYDEEIDKDGNVVVEETYYEVEDGVMEVVEESEYSIDADEEDDLIDVDDGGDDEVEYLEEELEEEEEINEELEEEVEDVENSLYYEQLEEEVLEEEVEEEYYENVYIFDDDLYENDYWSSNNWDEKWGDYECQQLFETDVDSIQFDPNVAPGNDGVPFVDIYGKCNSCDAYLVDYFSTEHFNNIKSYEREGLYYGLVGCMFLIFTAGLAFRQRKKPRKDRELGLIPNEDSTIV